MDQMATIGTLKVYIVPTMGPLEVFESCRGQAAKFLTSCLYQKALTVTMSYTMDHVATTGTLKVYIKPTIGPLEVLESCRDQAARLSKQVGFIRESTFVNCEPSHLTFFGHPFTNPWTRHAWGGYEL